MNSARIDIPTMRELGYEEELFGIWFSFLAPAGMPEDARKALVGAIEQAVKAPAITARLASLGILQSYPTRADRGRDHRPTGQYYNNSQSMLSAINA